MEITVERLRFGDGKESLMNNKSCSFSLILTLFRIS